MATRTRRTRRIFVGFAAEDKKYRDLLKGQTYLGGCPIAYTDFSVKQPWDRAWKTSCRQRLRGCNGMIALLSRNVRNAAGARWEIKCAVEEGIPVLGVYIHRTDLYKPPEIHGRRVVYWTWDGIANWIRKR